MCVALYCKVVYCNALCLAKVRSSGLQCVLVGLPRQCVVRCSFLYGGFFLFPSLVLFFGEGFMCI